MLNEEDQSELETAATEIRQEILADREDAPPRLKPLLTYIERHLFEPELDATHLMQACGIRDKSMPTRFHAALGRPPYGYIENCRMETASRLLCNTRLKIWKIATLLGYSEVQVFSRAFKRWSNMRPTEFRRREHMSRLRSRARRPLRRDG